MKEKNIIHDILEGLPEIHLDPIPTPIPGEKYLFNNILFNMKFTFEIIRENKLDFDILINNEKPDILKKDWSTIEMFNDGIITRI